MLTRRSVHLKLVRVRDSNNKHIEEEKYEYLDQREQVGKSM